MKRREKKTSLSDGLPTSPTPPTMWEAVVEFVLPYDRKAGRRSWHRVIVWLGAVAVGVFLGWP